MEQRGITPKVSAERYVRGGGGHVYAPSGFALIGSRSAVLDLATVMVRARRGWQEQHCQLAPGWQELEQLLAERVVREVVVLLCVLCRSPFIYIAAA